MNELQRIQEWYSLQCNDYWEHMFGVKIDTLDNPGWIVHIDLTETDLYGKCFEPVIRGDSDNDLDWVDCKVDASQFIGTGGALNLAELLDIFLIWAGRQNI